MSTLNNSKTIDTPAGLRVTVTASIHPGGVSVESRSVYSSEKRTLLWEELSNVELLAKLFADERVIVFQTIVEMLGKIHASRHIYEALL